MLKKAYLFLSPVFIFLIHLPFVFAKTKSGDTFPGSKNTKQVSSAAIKSTSIYAPIYDSLKLNTMGLSKTEF